MPAQLYRLIILVLPLWLYACSSPLKGWDPNDYTVKSGDTLYSIAWRYEIDPQDLVRWNRLQTASLIYPGQRLHTRKPDNFSVTTKPQVEDPEAELVDVVPSKPAKTRNSVVVKKYDTLYSIARANNVSAAQLVRANNLKKPYVIYPGQKLSLRKPVSTTVSKWRPKKNSGSKKPVTKTKSGKKTRLTWRWPVKGKVIKRFNRRRLDTKGIDISSKPGRAIKAAASGKVVYSGNGLISYGNLVIIKHNNTYLSAYANNRRLRVKEGQTVKQGQVIAESGNSAAKKSYLHFEIRKHGKPVDPLKYLPSS